MSYEYLKSIVTPRHIAVAASYLGTAEIPGAKSNPEILRWAKELGLDKVYKNDDTAWCGLFVCYVMKQAGRQVILNTKDAYDYLRALKYQGANLIEAPRANAAFGDLLIFQRPEGGHVGFYVGEDANNYHVLGGNQGNKVSVVKISKQRLVAVRRPEYITYSPEKMVVDVAGNVSSNEA